MNNLYDKFVKYYDDAFDRGDGHDRIAEVDAIYESYGLSESDGDMYECFNLVPEEAQLKILEILTPPLREGDPGYAAQFYQECLNDSRRSKYYSIYEDGVVDFYNALKAEGIDLGF